MTEQQIYAKCAWRLIPLMVLLYLVNFIDRLNVGFAALTMNRDLHFSPAVFGFGAGLFFIGYLLFQIPANLMLVRIGARRWIFCITAIWGLVSASSALVQGPASFYALRFLLGVAEAGLFPGVIFYLTLWFPKFYRARFNACFYIAIPLAGIIGGPLSGLILGMDGAGGLRGWQWLFLIEGMPAFVLSFVVLKLLPDRPAVASWLSGAEKDAVALRLAAEDSTEHSELLQALRDPRVAVLGLINFAFQCGLYGTTLWLPQIVQAMGFSNFSTGFVVALPNVVAMVAVILWGYSSDKRGERIWHIALPILLAAAGLAGASVAQDYLFVLFGLTLVLAGIEAAYGPYWSLPSTFLRGSAWAGGIALINMIASLGGFVGPFLLGFLKEQTGGYTIAMAMIAACLVGAAFIVLALGRAMAPRPILRTNTKVA